jgi:hypothetical protein
MEGASNPDAASGNIIAYDGSIRAGGENLILALHGAREPEPPPPCGVLAMSCGA